MPSFRDSLTPTPLVFCSVLRFTQAYADQGGRELFRLISLNFPSGFPGIGLLLLRATIGLAAVVQGGICLFDSRNPTLLMLVLGFLAIVSGVALLLGFLTQYASFLIGLGSIVAGFSWSSVDAQNLLNTRISHVFLLSMAVAIVLLGAGAYSLDARLFGRREIFIPQASRQPKP